MGVIKDGAVSGVLPSSEAFAIHYPGYPSSTSRALQTLGGLDEICKARCSQSSKLELHFRPEDPYSHPAFGELQPSQSFLLRISKKGSLANGETISAAEDSESHHLSADIIARVSDGMADYQHVVAVHADVACRNKRRLAEVEHHADKTGIMDMDQEQLMILVPPFFSLKDVPQKIALKPSVAISSKKKQEEVVRFRWEVPKKFEWQKYIPEGSDQWKWLMAVSNLFDERPIWTKASLYERLLDQGFTDGDNMLRRLLFRTSYYFASGPFFRFRIRKGYDPRKDPESRIYQQIDVRSPLSLGSHCDSNPSNELKNRWGDICAFQAFPSKFQISLQLFELADDYIQQEIRKPPQQKTCSRATGWFSSNALNRFRLRIAMRFLSICPKAGAESLLKLYSERFEKSKRSCMLTKDLTVGEGQEQLCTELAGQEDKDEPLDDGDENEDDEIEDDNVEEELEAYEPLHHAEDFSSQSDSHQDGNNISKNYLQELFGSFPFSEANELGGQDYGVEDEEYEIYEQDSDENYLEDDDY
ncbi:Transcription factor IIIC subunit 5, HTH domain [Dillenia turbinata]|uniref:Transcription factor IIIC subunit 5, HTH domain n=1 Tax=Dillenia turbinata TaxID=194707 RepID=A0AAN8VGG2_9MAGN